jgi:hypothetical protein
MTWLLLELAPLEQSQQERLLLAAEAEQTTETEHLLEQNERAWNVLIESVAIEQGGRRLASHAQGDRSTAREAFEQTQDRLHCTERNHKDATASPPPPPTFKQQTLMMKQKNRRTKIQNNYNEPHFPIFYQLSD